MGKSYAGTTNWEAAQNPSEHLKTIVPISGSIGVQQMFYRNGSSEGRALGYDLAYQVATSDMTTDDLRICSDDIIGPAMPITTSLAAEFGGADWSDYWEERYHLGDVLDANTVLDSSEVMIANGGDDREIRGNGGHHQKIHHQADLAAKRR